MDSNPHIYTAERIRAELPYEDPDWIASDCLRTPNGEWVMCECDACGPCDRKIKDDPKKYCGIFLKKGEDTHCGDCLAAKCTS